jgi:hypothetical protein
MVLLVGRECRNGHLCGIGGVGNGRPWLENGWTRLEMGGGGWKWALVVLVVLENGRPWLENGRTWLEMGIGGWKPVGGVGK